MKSESHPVHRSGIVTITYCTQCRWMLRATYMAQELLTTFSEEIEEVRLRPSTGGQYDIEIDDQLVFSRKEMGRFPDIKELKKIVRDQISPNKDLGHTDKH